MTTITRLLSAEEFSNLPDSGGRNELLNGELLPMSPANPRHGFIAFRIGTILDRFVTPLKLGAFFAAETGFIVSRAPDSILAPDVSFIFTAKIPSDGIPDKFLHTSPDFTVEVLSPNDSAQDVEVKAKKYLDAGTRLIWVVNPKTESVTVYQAGPTTRHLKKTDTITGEDVFPGFSCTVAEFFV